ncbi:MAG: hypothetical protein COV45_05670 [Deltaproteobacteria bacterium CG11_big_fil_rev_8_21_14_0_20_47_16]|nr:MAG: hypothetical protein COV45_05670 [Deltaproteobacteria bacterium CG11_big_fil_rev_8_21_14_0_20_47_16]
MTDVSLIVPIYSAEAFLQESLDEIDAHIQQAPGTWELLLVVDASRDGSTEICQQFAAQSHPYEVRVLVNDQNLGKGGTVKRGMLEAKGKYRIFIDCDMAYPMTDVDKILHALQNGSDMAVANRAHPDSIYAIHPKDFHYLYTRHLSSRIYNMVISRTLLRGWSDTQAGLKGFSAQAAEFIFSQTRLTGFSFDIEVLYLADRSQLKVTEIPIYFRYAREPSTMDFIRDAMRMLRDIWRVYSSGTKGEYNFNPPFHPPRRIVLNADDFGLSHGINEGIATAMERGIVGSTSLMVNFADSAAALEVAKKNNLSIGWHFNLTLGKPVSDPHTIPSLVRSNSTFYPRNQLLRRCFLRQVRADDVTRELEAQWKVFENAGLHPEHIDGHEHCHVFPVICTVVRNLVIEHQIPLVRLPGEKGGPFVPRYLTRLILGHLQGSRPKFWKETGCMTMPFYGISLVGRVDNHDEWRHLLARIADPISMVMVHPGIEHPGDDMYGDTFPGSRQAELDMILSSEWRQMLEEMRVEPISFKECLKELQANPSV